MNNPFAEIETYVRINNRVELVIVVKRHAHSLTVLVESNGTLATVPSRDECTAYDAFVQDVLAVLS